MPVTLRAFRSGHWPSLVGAWLHFEISFMVWLLIGALGVAASADSGTVVAAFFAPRLAQGLGWHAVFGLMTVPVLVTFLAYALMVPRGIGLVRQGARRDWWNASVATLRQPSMYSLCAAYAVTFGGFVGLSSFLPIFFHDQY